MEVGDHKEAILDNPGSLALFGAGLLHWTPFLSLAAQCITLVYEEDPGIIEDDQFICNDPYTAASHAPNWPSSLLFSIAQVLAAGDIEVKLVTRDPKSSRAMGLINSR